MRFVKPTVEWLSLNPISEVSLLKHIEAAGRTCYRSEDKITEDSCISFLAKLLGNGHMSVLEHSNIVFNMEFDSNSRKDTFRTALLDFLLIYKKAQYFTHTNSIKNFTMGGSLRAWVEALYLMDRSNIAAYTGLCANIFNCAFKTNYPIISSILEKLFFKDVSGINWHIPCPVVHLVDEEAQLKLLIAHNYDFPIFSVRLNIDRGLTHEVVRHRTLSPSQESTRWINYEKKLGIEFIQPFQDPNSVLQSKAEVFAKTVEDLYNEALVQGQSPQFARNILPNCLRSEIVLSGTWGACNVPTKFDLDSGWKHFLRQRLSKGAHPSIRLIAQEIQKHFELVGLFVN